MLKIGEIVIIIIITIFGERAKRVRHYIIVGVKLIIGDICY